MKVLVSGGTGFIGESLVSSLARSRHQVILLSRKTPSRRHKTPCATERWDARSPGAWIQRIEGQDAIVNLAGESIVGERWTEERKKKILDSRILSTRALVRALGNVRERPSVLVSASAVGYYGDCGNEELREDHAPGRGFLSDVCQAWEREALQAQSLGVRVVLLRTGAVIEKHGGALSKFIPPFKSFLGGPLGSGLQWFPWIYLGDMVSIILYSLQNSELEGPVNCTAPQSLRMSEFCSILGKAMGRPSWLPVPAFVLKTLLGEMAQAMLMSQRAVPARLQEAGFRFNYPDLDQALKTVWKAQG